MQGEWPRSAGAVAMGAFCNMNTSVQQLKTTKTMEYRRKGSIESADGKYCICVYIL